MAITIRTATVADVAIIAEYNCRLARETEAKELDRETVGAGVYTAIKDLGMHARYYLACEGEDVVGQLQVTLEWSDWRNGWFWWIQSVYVRADRRGRGIYSALYRQVRDAALAAGNVIGIRLYVERENHAAQATYAKLGMVMEPYWLMQDGPLR